MPRLILFNKPYGVITQFGDDGKHPTLKDYIPIPGVYPAGRLDVDSEGLLILTDDGALQHRLSHPRHKQPKTYWAQVEGAPSETALELLRKGVDLGDFVTRPARARVINEPPGLWERNPPIRFRREIPTHWIELVISEGKNRQVRRMTAKVGLPTLRLIRHAIGEWTLDGVPPGTWREIEINAAGEPPRPGRRAGSTPAPRRAANRRTG